MIEWNRYVKCDVNYRKRCPKVRRYYIVIIAIFRKNKWIIWQVPNPKMKYFPIFVRSMDFISCPSARYTWYIFIDCYRSFSNQVGTYCSTTKLIWVLLYPTHATYEESRILKLDPHIWHGIFFSPGYVWELFYLCTIAKFFWLSIKQTVLFSFLQER